LNRSHKQPQIRIFVARGIKKIAYSQPVLLPFCRLIVGIFASNVEHSQIKKTENSNKPIALIRVFLLA
jgi:hypothetical protein